MPQTAPQKINPGSKWFVIRSPDSTGAVVAKYETDSPVLVPSRVGDFIVVELPEKASLDDYGYNFDKGYLHPRGY